MLLRIQHETRLSYTLPVHDTVFEVRMAPPSNEDQTALNYRLKIEPQAQVTSYRDGLGNRVDLFNVSTMYRELVVEASSFVRTHRRPGTDRLKECRAVWTEGEPASIEAMEFLQASPLVPRCPEMDAFLSTLKFHTGPMVETIERLLAAVHDRLRYEKNVTRPRTSVGEALALGRGVCQDFSHVLIGACRGLGIPARYVSGYLNLPGEIATHAWTQIWAGDRAGWVDVDPTHGAFVGDDHVTTAVGRDYHDVPPNRGLWKGRAEESITVSVRVEPIERLPHEWDEWGGRAFNATRGRERAGSLRSGRRARVAYPNQPAPRESLHQQQAEQQQQS